MQVATMKTGAAAGDGLNSLAGRVVIKSAGESAAASVASRAPGLYDPSARVSLSVDAMLFLSKSRKAAEQQPALTQEEWNNKLTASLAEREFNAFGKYGETGDRKGYYRSYIEYYDGLSFRDQNSPRYFGTREAAMAGLRSLEYSESTDTGEQPQFVSLVGSQLPAQSNTPAIEPISSDLEDWGLANLYAAEDERSDGVSNIQKLYSEVF